MDNCVISSLAIFVGLWSQSISISQTIDKQHVRITLLHIAQRTQPSWASNENTPMRVLVLSLYNEHSQMPFGDFCQCNSMCLRVAFMTLCECMFVYIYYDLVTHYTLMLLLIISCCFVGCVRVRIYQQYQWLTYIILVLILYLKVCHKKMLESSAKSKWNAWNCSCIK